MIKKIQLSTLNSRYLSLHQAGFTLIELLVVIIVMLSIGGIVGGIFFVSLRSANKTNQVTSVRQNGNAALTQISRKLRYASKFIGISTDSITYSPNCTVSGSYLQAKDTDATGADVITTVFCPVNASGNAPIRITTNATLADVTDTNVSKVKGCVISCVKQATGSVSVNIKFDMVDKNDGSGLFENTVQPIHFDTTISLRNPQ